MDIGIVRAPIIGSDGKSAYELAVEAGFSGTLEQWLLSLKGEKGDRGLTGSQGPQGIKGDSGKSSYELAVQEGFAGTLEEWYDQFRVENILEDIIIYTEPFISIWNTANLSTGSSNNNQLKLPLLAEGIYDFIIEWGDGSSNRITEWNQAEVTHTYPRVGNYLITIKGTLEGWSFNNSGDKLKLIEIKSWGSLKLNSSGGFFYGCINLQVTAIDTFNTTGCTNFSNFFRGCTNLTKAEGLNYLNTASVTTMESMFEGSAFNGDISNLDFTNVTNLLNFLVGNSSFSASNYSKLLISLASQTLESGVILEAPLTNYLLEATASRDSIITNFNWLIQDAGL